MVDIHQPISESSSYSYKSIKYWCSTCNRQFSELSLDNAPVSSARCPRCNLFAEPAPQASSSGPSRPAAHQGSNTHPQPENRQDDGYVYDTQPVMDAFGRVFLQTFRAPANPQQRQQRANHDNANRNMTSNRSNRQENGSSGNIFSQFFGNLFGGFGNQNDAAMEGPNQYGPPPASKQAINNLKEVRFDKTQAHGDEELFCPICQEDYKQGESLVRLPCKHDYHKGCVGEWLSKHNSCPMCRKAI